MRLTIKKLSDKSKVKKRILKDLFFLRAFLETFQDNFERVDHCVACECWWDVLMG